MPIAPAYLFPPRVVRRPRRLRGLGLVPLYRFGNGFPVYPVRTGSRCPQPQSQMIMANATWDPINCRWIPNPISTAPVVSVAGTPVPAGFPTNQLFMAPDGSQWAYSSTQGKWINVGTPFDLSQASNPPAASTSTPATAAPAPVSVSVAPAAAAPSTYDTLINFATQESLINGIPNWIVGVGVLLGFKLVENWRASGGRR